MKGEVGSVWSPSPPVLFCSSSLITVSVTLASHQQKIYRLIRANENYINTVWEPYWHKVVLPFVQNMMKPVMLWGSVGEIITTVNQRCSTTTIWTFLFLPLLDTSFILTVECHQHFQHIVSCVSSQRRLSQRDSQDTQRITKVYTLFSNFLLVMALRSEINKFNQTIFHFLLVIKTEKQNDTHIWACIKNAKLKLQLIRSSLITTRILMKCFSLCMYVSGQWQAWATRS